MFFTIAAFMHAFVARRRWLFDFIFADIENPRYDVIRPNDAMIGFYLCGFLPFVPMISAGAIFLFYGIWWALLAFACGVMCAPLVIKIIWKMSVEFMLLSVDEEGSS